MKIDVKDVYFFSPVNSTKLHLVCRNVCCPCTLGLWPVMSTLIKSIDTLVTRSLPKVGIGTLENSDKQFAFLG